MDRTRLTDQLRDAEAELETADRYVDGGLNRATWHVHRANAAASVAIGWALSELVEHLDARFGRPDVRDQDEPA